jgi:putative CocE/NonD family hydrolase
MHYQESALSYKLRDIENVWIPVSDGCRLSARIWLPEGAEKVPLPAILEYIPYRKRDFIRLRDQSMHPWFAGNGYAVLRVDMRGSGESDGILHDEYLPQEQEDAVEVIAWIARQTWCSGHVGMMGKSWGAYNSLQVAARRPPELKAIIAVMGTDDRFNECIHFSGGCLLNDNFWWGCIMQLYNIRPPDPEIVGDRWREMWIARLQNERFWPEMWLHHQTRDDYWKQGSVCFDYGAITCPVWFWSGWADIFRDTGFRLAANLKVPRKITVGPWAHLYPFEARPSPAVGFLQEALRWWDYWLKGRDTGLMQEPPYQFYVMENGSPARYQPERSGRWIAEKEWPSPRVQEQSFVLNPGRLDADPHTEQALPLSSPQTTGIASGEMGSFAIPGDLPGDQSLDSFGSLEFDSEPLEVRLEIIGNVAALLDLSADMLDALVAVRLIDVAPDGRATQVTRGFLNLTHRDGSEAPTPLVPGKRYRVKVQLVGVAYAFLPGHRLRLAISNAYWPIVWPSPNPVTLTIFTGASRLLLPARRPQPDDTKLRSFPEPLSMPPTATTILRKGRVERSVTEDQVTGQVTHRLYIDGGAFGDRGKFRIDEVGLEIGHVYERIYSIKPDEPNSARATMTQTCEMGRGDWQIYIHTGAEMTSTNMTFELKAWVEAFEGDKPIGRRDWKGSIPRNRI